METKDWWIRAASGEIEFSLLAPTISRIFAFDLFIHNVDRHLTNYIVRKQRVGHSVLAFDYSRAWLWNGFPLPALPMVHTSKTVAAMRYMTSQFGFFLSLNDIKLVCDRLKNVTSNDVERLITEHPDIC